MSKAEELLYIDPFFEERMWGGTRLRSEFGYVTDVDPIGEAYNVVALPNHADCEVRGQDMTLSELYAARPELFRCDTEELPIRVNILDPAADLSVQLHPDEDYAQAHSHSRGKPEAWVILDTPEDGRIEFGHNARTHEEFEALVAEENWDGLLKYLPAQKDWFIDIPAGTMHAIGKGVLTYNISRNADCTYRLYDYGRINPSTGSLRPLHVREVCDCVRVPDEAEGFVWFQPVQEDGLRVTRYWDEPGLYTLTRIQTDHGGVWEQERFAFYTVVDGEGSLNGLPVKKGETVLVPHGTGPIRIEGRLDMFLASYENPS